MNKRTYVAPCVQVRQQKSEAITGLLLVGGLIATIGGVGTAEKVGLATGLVVAVVGLALMYCGTRRISR